jgi:hypothetical protein
MPFLVLSSSRLACPFFVFFEVDEEAPKDKDAAEEGLADSPIASCKYPSNQELKH